MKNKKKNSAHAYLYSGHTKALWEALWLSG